MEPHFPFSLSFVLIVSAIFFNVSDALAVNMNENLDDASDVTWAHAVNSQEELEKALKSSVNFIEADVLMGYLKGYGIIKVPIMAHPPNQTSDLTLELFLDTVASRGAGKNLKLDFKSVEVLEPSMKILEIFSSQLNSSVWLNADVIPGPINSRVNPVPVEEFLTICNKYFPNATLSIGWTTLLLPTSEVESWHYEWYHMRQMADLIRCRKYKNNSPKFTFPVRAIFASRSIKQFQWLLSVVSGSSLTVWSSQNDPLDLQDLLRIRSSFPKNLVYYDVPDKIFKAFNESKNNVNVNNELKIDDKKWMTITSGNGEKCSSLSYVSNDTIFFGKNLTTVVLRKNLFSLDDEPNLNVSGRILFLSNDDADSDPENGFHEFKLVAVDVSLFSKNKSEEILNEKDISSSDSDVILSAVNSSAIYTIEHDYSETETFCHVFKLDTTADESFQVWTVSCEDMLQKTSLERLIENGTPEISSRKRLVLPKEPFMLGFASTGGKYVLVDDLKIVGQKNEFTLNSESAVHNPAAFFIFSCILCLLALV